uniref:SCP2 domain-containing protein n=1 Tax=Rhipicephalus microplus TaxID=6941 RepID=A0A6G4ZYT5_RHIMP
MFAGSLKPTAAFMSGKMKIKGDSGEGHETRKAYGQPPSQTLETNRVLCFLFGNYFGMFHRLRSVQPSRRKITKARHQQRHPLHERRWSTGFFSLPRRRDCVNIC